MVELSYYNEGRIRTKHRGEKNEGLFQLRLHGKQATASIFILYVSYKERRAVLLLIIRENNP